MNQQNTQATQPNNSPVSPPVPPTPPPASTLLTPTNQAPSIPPPTTSASPVPPVSPAYPPYPSSPNQPPPNSPSTVVSNQSSHKLSNYIKILIIIIIYIGLAGLSYFFYTSRQQSKTTDSSLPQKPTPTQIASGKTPEVNLAEQPPSIEGFGKLLPTDKTSSQKPPWNPSISPIISPSLTHPPSTPVPTRKKPSVDRQNFFITATNNTFTPNLFYAEAYQIIDVILTATDKNYDIAVPEINVYKVIPKGTKDFVEFQVLSEGTYHILCRDLCGGAPQASAILIVK